MKKVFLVLVVIFTVTFFSSCEENITNMYEIEDTMMTETLEIISVEQIFEESRDAINWGIYYSGNSRIGGEILLQVVDRNSTIIYEAKKVLTKSEGKMITGELYQMKLDEHVLIIRNVGQNYAYMFPNGELPDSHFEQNITPVLSDFEFSAVIEAEEILPSNGRIKSSEETIEISGGRVNLQAIRLYRKFHNSEIKPWEVYRQISIDYGSTSNKDASESSNWVEHDNGYYSIDIEPNNWSFFSLFFDSNTISIYEYINEQEQDVSVDVYTEYVFEDSYDITYEFQTTTRNITITKSPNIDDIEIDTDDVYVGDGIQKVAEITAEVIHTDIQIERTDLYVTMDEYPWETFTRAQLKLTNGSVITINNLNDADNWDSFGDKKYRLRISGYADTVEAGDDIEHEFSMEPNADAEEVDVTIYFNIRVTDINGITDIFETQEDDFEVHD